MICSRIFKSRLEMGKFDFNPFARSALKSADLKLLAGRSNELRDIRFVLRNSAKSKDAIRNLIISGNRGVGKTSFLNLIEGECQLNNLLPIRINLNESNSANTNEFFWYLFKQSFDQVLKLGLFDGIGGEIDNSINNILLSDSNLDAARVVFRTPVLRKHYLASKSILFEFDQFVEDLRLIRKEITTSRIGDFDEKTKILFLVDETQLIYSNIEIIQDLRYIVQQSEIGIGFVFAGDTSYSTTTWEKVFGGSHRDFDIIDLNNFKDTDSVIEYFKKSLSSVGWTGTEIEETLFYRFQKACYQIFLLTSGRPAWINTIASKMFERCMKGESPVLKFDKAAQNDVKTLLESTKEIDAVKLDKIETFSSKHQKWLSDLFDCEYSSLRQVYFYGKFKYINDDFLSEEEYITFCKNLINAGILSVFPFEDEEKIGFKPKKSLPEFLDNIYYAFDHNSDTMKQWLQISSGGKFEFGYTKPSSRFILFVNRKLVTEESRVVLLEGTISENEEPLVLAELLQDIDKYSKRIGELSYSELYGIYRISKNLEESNYRQILFGLLKNNLSGSSTVWNISNFSEKDKGVPFYESERTMSKLQSAIESYNHTDINYSFSVAIKSIQKPNIELLQRVIIKSKDRKKFGIVMEDKMEDLIRYYIKESNIESSYQSARFFKELFDEGYDLDLRQLNNSAYVFVAKNLHDEASSLLRDGIRKITQEELDEEDNETACLIYYNYGILCWKTDNYEDAQINFNKVISINNINSKVIGRAAVLFLLIRNEKNEIEIIEAKEGDPGYPNLNCKEFSELCLKAINYQEA